ncbi:MAG: hypothetical protein ABI585_00030 [Betaproteobacteria bacterium]
MQRLTTKLERTTIAAAAIALTAITLLGATVAPANADQPVTNAKLKPTVEVVLVSMQPATRVN